MSMNFDRAAEDLVTDMWRELNHLITRGPLPEAVSLSASDYGDFIWVQIFHKDVTVGRKVETTDQFWWRENFFRSATGEARSYSASRVITRVSVVTKAWEIQ